MGLGNTAKKLQRVADMAEDVYQRLNELREQVGEMRETVEQTERRTDRLEAEFAEQRALLEAIADDAGIDIEEVSAGAHIGEADADADASNGTGEDAAGDATESAEPAGASSE